MLRSAVPQYKYNDIYLIQGYILEPYFLMFNKPPPKKTKKTKPSKSNDLWLEGPETLVCSGFFPSFHNAFLCRIGEIHGS